MEVAHCILCFLSMITSKILLPISIQLIRRQ